MAYWFIINTAWGTVHLEKTHNWIWSGENVVEINGISVVWIQGILDNLRATQTSINFLLSDWAKVSFNANSTHSDWNNKRIAENA